MKKLLLVLLLMSTVAGFGQVGRTDRMHPTATMQRIGAANFFQSNLMNKYDITHLKLDITAVPNNNFIMGSCTYQVMTVQLLDTFAIEFKQNMSVDSVFVNDVKTNFLHSSDHIYVPMASAIGSGNIVNIQIFYRGNVTNAVYYGSDTNNGLMFTANVSEPFEAREWFPAKQLLNDKIDSTDVWITTFAPYLAGSNGLLVTVVDLLDNRKQFRWKTHYPMSYYMPCFAVGNYLDYRNYAKPTALSNDSILIQHYVVDNPTFFNNVKARLDKTPRFVEKMSDLFGLYPFWKEKYGHLHAKIGGGMEHQTMSTMEAFDEYLVAHELGHQWFGDYVTCATWSDIWLNEGFASYAFVLMQEYLPALFPTTAATQMHDVDENIMSQPGGSVYVPAAGAYNEARIFDPRLTYNKGCAVLHNLRFEMQDDSLFFRTLKLYLQRYANSFATTEDFKHVAEEVTGRNFTSFFNQWVYGEGFPTYNISYGKQDADTLVINVNQTTSMPSVTPLFTGLMEYKIRSSEGDTIVKLKQLTNNQTFKIYYTHTPTAIEVDPNNWVVNAVGNNGVLPVNLLTFSGNADDGLAKLVWTTTNQMNVSEYEIQRAADGNLYQTIGRVTAKSANNNTYSFIDNDALPDAYYRLKIVNADGTFTYSKTIFLQLHSILVVRYQSQSSHVSVQLNFNRPTSLRLSVISVDGKRLMNQSRKIAAGNIETSFNLQQLPAGIYNVEVSTSNERKVLKVFKQ